MKMITPAGFGLFGVTLAVVLSAVTSWAVHSTLASTSEEPLSGIQQELSGDVLDEQNYGASRNHGDFVDGCSAAAKPKVRDAQNRAKDGDSVVQIEALPDDDHLLAAPSGASDSRRCENAGRNTEGFVTVGVRRDLRKTSLFPIDVGLGGHHKLTVRVPPEAPDRSHTLICQGGVHIVSQSPTLGMIDIEANEAEFRSPRDKEDHNVHEASGWTWVDDENRPMEVHLKGNVVVRQDRNGVGYPVDRRIIRAERVDYELGTGRLTAINAVVLTVGSYAPSGLRVDRISLPPFVTRHQSQSRTSADDSGSLAR